MKRSDSKKRVRIIIDDNKWKEISRRIPNTDLSLLVDMFLDNLLTLAVESGTEIGVMYNQASAETLVGIIHREE